MRTFACELTTPSAVGHLQQIFTGFAALARAGAIELAERFEISRDRSGDWTLAALIDGRRVIYDVGDNHPIDETRLRNVDFYFKRSFLDNYVAGLGDARGKVYPLGLNYEVYPDHRDFAGARRSLFARQGTRRLSGALSALKLKPGFVPRQTLLEGDANDVATGRVLFLTRVWDPRDRADREDVFVRQREEINDMRARCVERLRRHFGERVMAGFAQTDYAERKYPSLLVPDQRLTLKQNYLAAVNASDVCITTTGVHGSIGWKLGEYVALGKAIVSERLLHTVPGNFEAGANYLEFSDDDECIAMTDQLLSDPIKRRQMRLRNLDYYRHFLRPDRLVLNTLNIVGGTVG